MKNQCKHPILLILSVTVIGILLDQLTKLLVSSYMELGESIPLIRDVLHITYIQNRGAAFGMLADNRWVFLIVSTVTILAIGLYLFLAKPKSTLLILSLSMILSGGIGNMIDRLALGYVVDMIDFCLINFAVFNGADSFVCVGAGLLFLAVLLEKDEPKAPAAEGGEADAPDEGGADTDREEENA